MRFLLTSAFKDTKRRLADPAALAMWIGLPILVGTLMSLVGGGNQAVPRARLLLVDQDDTALSQFVANAATGGVLGDFLDIERVTLEEGRRRMDAGDATALLVLPDGFQQAVLGQRPADMTLVTNPSQRILPQMIEEGLTILVEAAFYLEKLLGEPLRRIAEGPAGGGDFFSGAAISAISVDINERMKRLGPVLFPPVIAVQMPSAQPSPRPTSLMGTLMFPSMLFMSLLMIAQGVGIDIWIEKRQGTLRRALSAPHPFGWFAAGKLASGAIFMATVTIVGLLLGLILVDATAGRLLGAFVWCTFIGTALLCYLTSVQILASTERGANVVATMIVFPLMMIGGSFFPFEVMPGWMVAIGRWTPNGQGLIQLKAILFGTPDGDLLALAAAGVGLPAALAFLLSVRRMRGSFAMN